MTTPTILWYRKSKPVPLVTYIGECCREWVLAAGIPGRCGLCGEIPTYKRSDDGTA